MVVHIVHKHGAPQSLRLTVAAYLQLCNEGVQVRAPVRLLLQLLLPAPAWGIPLTLCRVFAWIHGGSCLHRLLLLWLQLLLHGTPPSWAGGAAIASLGLLRVCLTAVRWHTWREKEGGARGSAESGGVLGAVAAGVAGSCAGLGEGRGSRNGGSTLLGRHGTPSHGSSCSTVCFVDQGRRRQLRMQ